MNVQNKVPNVCTVVREYFILVLLDDIHWCGGEGWLCWALLAALGHTTHLCDSCHHWQ